MFDLLSPIPGANVTLAATSSSSRVKLGGQPLKGAFQVAVYNPGTTVARVRFGDVTVAAVGTTDVAIAPGTVRGFSVSLPDRTGDIYAAVIMDSGTATVEFATGYGI